MQGLIAEEHFTWDNFIGMISDRMIKGKETRCLRDLRRETVIYD